MKRHAPLVVAVTLLVATGAFAAAAASAPKAVVTAASAPVDQARAAQRAGKAVMTSAEECGRCHRDIYRYWKASLHAQSADDPRFQAAFGSALTLRTEWQKSHVTPSQLTLRSHLVSWPWSSAGAWHRRQRLSTSARFDSSFSFLKAAWKRGSSAACACRDAFQYR